MDGHITLDDAIDGINSTHTKGRSEGLANLKHILRHNQHNAKIGSLNDKTFLGIFQTLFQAAGNERASLIKAKTQLTKTASTNRLSEVASALRHTVDTGVRSIQGKTVKAIIDHIVGSICNQTGEFCEPLAVDYAKCLRIVLSHQPHTEHLFERWEELTAFCIECINKAESEIAERNGVEPTSTSGTTNGQSYRSSRSTYKESAGSQPSRSVSKPIAEEMIACLQLLTVAPIAPIHLKAPAILWTIIDFLKSSATVTGSHKPAFMAVNQVISWARTEDTALTHESTGHLVRLISQLWSSKSNALEEMLATLLLLRPYIFHAMRQSQVLTLRSDLVGLLRAIKAEYARRQDRGDVRQLSLEDIRLEPDTASTADDAVATGLFSLKCSGHRIEANWILVYMIASLHNVLIGDKVDNDAPDHGDEMDIDHRPRKRQRLDDEFTNLTTSITEESTQGRTSSIQIMAFLTQQTVWAPKQLSTIIRALSISCSEENGSVSPWAFLALASCASQTSAQDSSLASHWMSVWQLSSRGLSNASSCRAAAYVLYLLCKLRLVPQANVPELIHVTTNAIDLSGPSLMSDGVSMLLQLVLRASQQLNPVSSSLTADSIINWLSQTFTPSKMDDKSYVLSSQGFEACDLVSLVCACLNQQPHRFLSHGFRTWDAPARAWLLCKSHKATVAYLLLDPEDPPITNLGIAAEDSPALPSGASSRTSGEALVIANMLSETSRMIDSWKTTVVDRGRQPSGDSFAMLCKAGVALLCIATCISFRDSRRQSQLRSQIESFLNSLEEHICMASCDEAKADTLFFTFSSAFSALAPRCHDHEYHPAECEILICKTVKNAAARRQNAKAAADDDDPMELDGAFDSQESRQGQTSPGTIDLSNDLEAAYSKTMLRSSAALYANACVALYDGSGLTNVIEASASVMKYLRAQSEIFILSARGIVTLLPDLGLHPSAQEADNLLDHFMQNMMPQYRYARSEVAIGTILDVSSSLSALWTDPSNKSLYGLGLDIYEWFLGQLLPRGILSHNVQKRLASLLLQLCRVDLDYGQETKAPSARTSLFKLLGRRNITVQFHLADHIPALFHRFVLSRHSEMFQDLYSSFVDEVDWLEGVALRLLFLSRLASMWPSLLTQCVYHMFEIAGRVEGSLPYATRCVEELAALLPLESPRKLFSLFAPQLLYTWLESEQLAKLPFAAFQYSSLNDLLSWNRTEACAQVVMRDSKEGLKVMSKALKLLDRDLARRAFAKSLAYSFGHDAATPRTESSTRAESSFRGLLGDKDYGQLLSQQYPTVMGYFFLTAESDDWKESWMNKLGYSAAEKALQEMMKNGHSDRELPKGQQPSFRSKFIPHQIDLMCKRMKYESTPWSDTQFTLSARMLIDAMDDSMGSLHSCLMIRRLRLLISMAGNVALEGFAIEMLLHSLRPFVSDSECADDTIGILWYLFRRGERYLKSNPTFLTGTTILLILQMRVHSNAKHDSTTQESQHVSTVQKMKAFQGFLVKFLKDATSEQDKPADSVLVRALEQIRLPGNAHKDSPESSLLLLLLDQWQVRVPMCSRTDLTEAVRLLSENFEMPSSVSDDCLGDDSVATRFTQQLFEIIGSGSMTGNFITWAASALGRAYAANGIRPNAHTQQMTSLRERIISEDDYGIALSQATIAERLAELLYSKHRIQAGLADFTLRRLLEIPNDDADEAGAFDQMLPPAVLNAFNEGTYGYEPVSAMQRSKVDVDIQALRLALKTSESETLEQWTTRLASAVCGWASNVPIVSSLAALIRNIEGLAVELLPSMLHILLSKEIETGQKLREELSTAVSDCLSQSETTYQPKQRFLLQLLLYLRSQPHPRESTQADRLLWLEVDCSLVAECASRCSMPTTALLYAESAVPATQSHGNKRSSSRMSVAQLQPVQASEELLLSIYQQLDEPDSFYGVQQSASLDSVLSRLDHERDGFRSLMFRSAQMDSRMRSSHTILDSDAAGMVHSLSTLNFSSLTFALLTHGLGGTAHTSAEMLTAAKTLQQWDVTLPESDAGDSSLTFSVFQELSRAMELPHMHIRLKAAINDHIQLGLVGKASGVPSRSWLNTLASITEVEDIVCSLSPSEVQSRWHIMQRRENWMHFARFDDVHMILSNRQTLFSTLRQNASLQKALHLTAKQCHSLEVEALLDLSKLAREDSKLQEALTATTTLNGMADLYQATNLKVGAAIKVETASVLWDANEASSSVRMLRDSLNISDMEQQEVPVGRAGLLATLGHQLGQARLEKPDEILSKYLKPAISHLKDRKDDKEAGKVFFEFAKFCDNEYQSPANVENFSRMVKLRQGKEEEVGSLRLAQKNLKRTREDPEELRKSLSKAEKWLEIDKQEEKRLRHERNFCIHQGLQNYLLALRATDEHDICVLRFFALWLENADDNEANGVVYKYLPDVPSWKLVLLMNQLMSRVEKESTTFQRALQKLLCRIFADHPHHSLHHLYAASRTPSGSDAAAMSRYTAAAEIYQGIINDPKQKIIAEQTWRTNRYYKMLAEDVRKELKAGKHPLKDVPIAFNVAQKIKAPAVMLPPATISLPLRPSGNYNDAPVIERWDSTITIMGGLSAPKLMKAIGSDGEDYKQLFKGGDDDLRQDAIMEQVFEEVSKMLRNHKATRQRDLKVRTYKVIPLTSKCGIIEFVPDSLPINDFLKPAHRKYYPHDYTDSKARTMIDNAVKTGSTDLRIKEWRKICENMHPVMRHFFFERFDDPDEWFEKRTAYTRTTASISILGHVLGLGDRHCSNILLDQKTGECVHIDLGVAFEGGRVLPIPELVPFRLTRDIIDGMGATGTEGVFRRCCEFTLEAVREDKDSIMTLLNVLRYDPLYTWTVSSGRAKRMQEGQDSVRNGGINAEGSSTRQGQDAGEAERALTTVEKKLSKTLSTAAAVNELIQQATDEKHLATLFHGWAAFF